MNPGDWTHCLYCGYPLTSGVSQHDGFGSSCYVKLDAPERAAILAAAVRAREAGEQRIYWRAFGRRERWLMRFGLLMLH